MKRLLSYFSTYFGLFAFLINLGNISCDDKGDKVAPVDVTEDHFEDGDYEHPDDTGSATSLYVSNNGWGSEDPEEGGGTYGGPNNPYITLDEAVDVRRRDHAGSTVFIYIEGGGDPYEINLSLTSDDDDTYFVGVNSPMISPANNTTLIDHTIELSGASNTNFTGLIIAGISATYTGNSANADAEYAAATVYIRNSTATFDGGTNIDSSYYQAVLIGDYNFPASSDTSIVTLDTISITTPEVGAYKNNAIAVFASLDTTVHATDVTITSFDRGFVAYYSTVNVAATGSDHSISGASEAAIYYTNAPGGSVTGLASTSNALSVFGWYTTNVTFEDVYFEAANTVKFCGDDSATYNAAVNNSIVVDMEVEGITLDGSGAVTGTLTYDYNMFVDENNDNSDDTSESVHDTDTQLTGSYFSGKGSDGDVDCSEL